MYFKKYFATEHQSIRASEHQSIRASEHQSIQRKLYSYPLKLILCGLILMFSFISNSTTFALDLSSTCCHNIVIDTNVAEDCCTEIIVNNPHCPARIQFQYYNPTTNNYQTKHIDSSFGSTSSFIICPENGESILKFRINFLHPTTGIFMCNEGSPVEGYNQYTFEIDVTRCCECPENSFNSWFKTIVAPHPDCQGGCKVQHTLDLPTSMSCYKYYHYENPPLGIFFGSTANNIENFPISNFDRCISYGQLSDAYIYLVRNPDDVDYCLLRDTARCDTTAPPVPLPEPCDKSCPDSTWKSFSSTLTGLQGCSNCNIIVHYKARTNCEGKQQLEIMKVDYLNPNECFGCSMDYIMVNLLKKIVHENKMTFKPLINDNCDTTWQVYSGSCWSSYYQYYLKWDLVFDPENPLGLPTTDSILVNIKCDTVDCCFMPLTVCRFNDSIQIIPTLAPDILLCENYIIWDLWGRIHQCTPHCSWMSHPDLTIPFNFSFYSIFEDPFEKQQHIYQQITNFKLNHSTLSASILTNSSSKGLLRIFNIQGNNIRNDEISLKSGINNLEIDVNYLINGIYLFTIVQDGRIVKTGKFTVIQ